MLPSLTDQIRAVRSSEAVATSWPSGLNAAPVIRLSCPTRSFSSVPSVFNRCAALSLVAARTRSPSGLKTTCCHLSWMVATSAPVAAFHNRAVPRVELAARRSPFGLN